MIKSPLVRINIRLLSNEVFAHFFGDVITYIDRFGAGAIGIKQASDDLKVAVNKVKSILDAVRKSRFTEKLEAQDKYRDEFCRGITAMIKAFLYNTDVTELDDARALNLLFEHYSNLPKRSYDAESEAIDDLFRELDKAENVARIARFGLTAVIARFRETNDTFNELMHQRYDQAGERPEITMQEARAEVKEKFELLIYRLDGIIAINGIDFTEELSGFVHSYNIVATRYKNILAQGKGRRKAAREKEKNESPDNEESNNTIPEFPDEQ